MNYKIPFHLKITIIFNILQIPFNLTYTRCSYVLFLLQWACGAKPHSLTKHTLIDTLVENGADLTAVDQNGHCCLFYAASSGDLLIVKTLVEEFNVDISRTNAKGKTPAEMAVGKCASYLHHCLKNPPKKNRDFVPERYLKKDPVAKRLKEPRSIGTYLMKKSPSLLKGWQKRYFVMKEGYLRYYGTVSTMCIFVYVYFSLSTYVLYLLIIESGI